MTSTRPSRLSDLKSLEPPPKRKRQLWTSLRILVTLAAFAYIFSRIEFSELIDAWGKLDLGSTALAFLCSGAGILLGALRWRHVLRAYGAVTLPNLKRTLHLYMVGFFYNMYAPGGVGGDVVRAVASREAFGTATSHAVTGSLVVVLVERITGVIGMLTLCTLAYLIWPIESVASVRGFALIGLGIALAAPAIIGTARKIGTHIPGKLGQWLRMVPELQSWTQLWAAVAFSFFIQFFVALSGHFIIAAMDPSVMLTQSLVLMPLIAATAFFPLTVGGAGAREAAFVVLYAMVGVPKAIGLAASLVFWAVQLVLGALGGMINFIFPTREKASDET